MNGKKRLREATMKILKAKDVSLKTSFSVGHIHRLARENKFPKPIQISENRKGWLASDIDDWIEKCIKERTVSKFERNI